MTTETVFQIFKNIGERKAGKLAIKKRNKKDQTLAIRHYHNSHRFLPENDNCYFDRNFV